MTDYKVLCARLCGAIAATDNKPRALDDAYAEAVAALAEPDGCDFPVCIDDDSEEGTCSRWLAGGCEGPASATRAALAKPRIITRDRDETGPYVVVAQPEPEGPSADELIGLALRREPWATWLRSGGCLESAHCELADLMLAAIARWGRPAAAPVPVSERLPGPEDCDAEGRCWWWDGEWGLVEPRFVDFCATHWLPAHALPLPTPEAKP